MRSGRYRIILVSTVSTLGLLAAPVAADSQPWLCVEVPNDDPVCIEVDP